MNNRDYRELQLSSTQLIMIFLALIAVGVVIFLLGISVGKKQSQVTGGQQAQTEQIIAQKPVQQESQKTDRNEAAEKPVIKQQTTTPPPVEEKKVESKPQSKPQSQEEIKQPVQSSSSEVKNQYYIQVGAYSKKEGAMSLADEFKSQGYPAIILDPLPTDRRAIFRVRVGGYATREEAETAKQELLKLTGKNDSDYFIRFVK
ncbi:SPOR domain-containing protein [Acidobacteriota bacterium]